ncbi:MAG: 3-oxoacyl-ACP synthase [Comamonadaceae bacterium]|nr:MAG: 3-oxoacyl-ACP synthase [Comamonadaceae bacterium]
MPVAFDRVYLHSSGYHMPGAPVDNDAMDAYIAPLNRMSDRIKRRVLGENGIKTRHYAIDPHGNTTCTNTAMAAHAIEACLTRGGRDWSTVSMLASGSSGGDVLMPGFANMIQGHLSAPPLEVMSVHGICAAGVGAIQAAAQGIELGAHQQALAVASELPSRLFKRSRFATQDYNSDFDAHFLRWMLSDGAGAMLLGGPDSALAGQPGIRLKLKFIHQRSFSGDYPVCMQLGMSADGERGHLDYDGWADAEADGALSLRQNIRLLPNLFDVSIHEYATLVRDGWMDPARVSHFLCHYSSEKFMPVVDELMQKAGLAIPKSRWWSNLAWRGNTGAASILIMLAEFLETHTLTPGEQVFCYIPESGRFMTAYMLFEAEAVDADLVTGSGSRSTSAADVAVGAAEGTHSFTDAGAASAPPSPTGIARAPAAAHDASASWRTSAGLDTADQEPNLASVIAPHDPATAPAALAPLLTELAGIWHDYRSRVWRTPLVRALTRGEFSMDDYCNWMAQWVPQVREGSLWMREGAANLRAPFDSLSTLIDHHAGEEQNDFKILFDDYTRAGGKVKDIDQLTRNPGGQALNAYLHALAATPNPIGLMGAIYVIEGTGQRIVPHLLPLLKSALALTPDMYRFLEYHGHNDQEHLDEWLMAVEMVMSLDDTGTAAQRIVDTARQTASLYLMQFEHIMNERPRSSQA